MRSVTEHRDAILSAISPLPPAELALADCLGLVTTAGISSRVPLPGFDNSAMDGYAVRAASVVGASAATPVTLTGRWRGGRGRGREWIAGWAG